MKKGGFGGRETSLHQQMGGIAIAGSFNRDPTTTGKGNGRTLGQGNRIKLEKPLLFGAKGGNGEHGGGRKALILIQWINVVSRSMDPSIAWQLIHATR